MNIDTNNQPYYQEQQRQQSVIQMDINSRSTSSPAPLQLIRWAQRPKFASSFWEEENTFCYQVDAKNICVARRQDNDMINGTKLLNVTGMSRGKRDGILKNEKARVVVKVGPMHLKGVWIPFGRAKELAHQFKISEILHPLFLDDPSIYFRNMQYHHTSPELYNFTVQSQSKPEYFPTDARHHVYPSYQRLQQYQGYSPITPTQPEFQIPSSSDQFYQQPPLMSYPPTPTDASFSFDTSTFSNQQQQQQQQPQEFNMYHNFNI